MTQLAIMFQQQSDDSRGCLRASGLSRALIEGGICVMYLARLINLAEAPSMGNALSCGFAVYARSSNTSQANRASVLGR
jgi:hypothetical protein